MTNDNSTNNLSSPEMKNAQGFPPLPSDEKAGEELAIAKDGLKTKSPEPATDTGIHESNLVKHAKRELKLIGYETALYNNTDEPVPAQVKNVVLNARDDDGFDMNAHITLNIMELVKLFASQGHSGFSGSYVIQIITKLLNFENLTPLTNDPAEWIDHGGTPPRFQNSRNGSAFSEDGGKTYYLLEESIDPATGRRLPDALIPMHTAVSKEAIVKESDK